MTHETETLRRWMKERRELQTRVDFLSAEREISLVLNQDVEFEAILEKVLGITADLIGGKERHQIEIHLKDSKTGKLVLRAAWQRGQVLFGKDLDRTQEDPTIQSALDFGRLITASDQNGVTMAIPLASDRDWIGVMKLSIPLEGDAAEKEEGLQLLTHNMDEFAKFISLAIKTPDLYTRATEDGLTGLATKRHFLNQLRLAYDYAQRYKEPLTLLMIDIDHFKSINDTHGHMTGDLVLKGVAELIMKGIRHTGDAAYSGYRYGGEEMSVILPKADVERASVVAERLRKRIEEKKFTSEKKQLVKVTVSIGVAQLAADVTEPDGLISRADRALYTAKREGRNRVCLYNGK